MKRPFSTNPRPDHLFEHSSYKELLDEIKLIALRRWEPPCIVSKPASAAYTDPGVHISGEEVETLRGAARNIARQRGIPPNVGLEAIEMAGLTAFRDTVLFGLTAADENFDVRAFALVKARSAMDNAARRKQFKTEARPVLYDVDSDDADDHLLDNRSGHSHLPEKDRAALADATQGHACLTDSENRSLSQIGLLAKDLPERLRIVVEKSIEGYSKSEIAMVLRVSYGTVDRAFHLAAVEISGKFRAML